MSNGHRSVFEVTADSQDDRLALKWWCVLSNASAIPAALELIKKREWVEALILLQSATISAVYHMYDCDITSLEGSWKHREWYWRMENGDHLNAILTILVMVLYMLLDTNDRYNITLAAMPGYLLLAADKGSLWSCILWTVSVNVLGIFVLRHKRRYLRDLNRKWLISALCCLVLGILGFMLGSDVGKGGRDPSYQLYHGLWHWFIFLLPVCLARAVGSSPRREYKNAMLRSAKAHDNVLLKLSVQDHDHGYLNSVEEVPIGDINEPGSSNWKNRFRVAYSNSSNISDHEVSSNLQASPPFQNSLLVDANISEVGVAAIYVKSQKPYKAPFPVASDSPNTSLEVVVSSDSPQTDAFPCTTKSKYKPNALIALTQDPERENLTLDSTSSDSLHRSAVLVSIASPKHAKKYDSKSKMGLGQNLWNRL